MGRWDGMGDTKGEVGTSKVTVRVRHGDWLIIRGYSSFSVRWEKVKEGGSEEGGSEEGG